MALGADAQSIRRMVLREEPVMVLTGLVLGVACALDPLPRVDVR